MNPRHCIATALLAVGVTLPSVTGASGLSVEVWTHRGRDAVFRPGEALEVKARLSHDAHLLVYEIDSEGYVHLLFPEAGRSGFVEGRVTHLLPGDDSETEWVVQEPVGQGYIVAIASIEPFRDLPWYLRPYDRQAANVGYHDRDEADDEGLTAEGRIVGDPFVAMERIRRRLVADHEDEDAFSTAYTSYYVHQEVRYPRYLCYDCHRPGYWSWWDGFDPYYAQCSVFDVRVNWHWTWGPRYWFGHTPYFVYVYRTTCPTPYRAAFRRGDCYSSWDGWRRWNSLWGSKTRRYKTPPPLGYDPPSPRDHDRRWKSADRRMPPGYVPAPGVDDPSLAVVRAGTRGGSSDPGSRSGLTRRSLRDRGAGVEPIRGTLGRTIRDDPGDGSQRDRRSLRDRGAGVEPVRGTPRGTTRDDPSDGSRRGGIVEPPRTRDVSEVGRGDDGQDRRFDRGDLRGDGRRDRKSDQGGWRDDGPRDRKSDQGGRRDVGRQDRRPDPNGWRDAGRRERPSDPGRSSEVRREPQRSREEVRVERREAPRDRGSRVESSRGRSSDRGEKRRSR